MIGNVSGLTPKDSNPEITEKSWREAIDLTLQVFYKGEAGTLFPNPDLAGFDVRKPMISPTGL